LAAWCAPRGWQVSLQGRKVYAVPVPLTKSAAAREVLRRTGGATLLAAGDSLLDADLLDAADAAVRPAHGELADTGWTRPHVAVTAARGGWAGEEILAWLLQRCAPERAAAAVAR
ncbi:MAG: HAD family hydrolase, partial [Pseudonocardia sp.]|nr:HAD family hydrolase [Pseudonocardia sp.]